MKSLEVACKQNKIPHPRQTTLQFCYEGIKRCNDKIKEYAPVAWPKRREFMVDRLNNAREEEDETRITQIERIMMTEDSKHTWGRLKCATKKKRSPPASQVAITDENGQRSVVAGQEPFQEAVSHAIGRQYRGATDASINSG